MGDGDAHGGTVGERDERLNQTFTEGLFAEDDGASVVLKGAAEHLGRAGGALVDEDAERSVGVERGAIRLEDVAFAVRVGDERVDGRQALFVLPQLRTHLGVDRHVRDELAGRRRQVGVGLGQQRDDGRDGVAAADGRAGDAVLMNAVLLLMAAAVVAVRRGYMTKLFEIRWLVPCVPGPKRLRFLVPCLFAGFVHL